MKNIILGIADITSTTNLFSEQKIQNSKAISHSTCWPKSQAEYLFCISLGSKSESQTVFLQILRNMFVFFSFLR